MLHARTACGGFLGLRRLASACAEADAAVLVLTFADTETRDETARALEPLCHATGLGVREILPTTEINHDWVAKVASQDRPLPLGRRFVALPGNVKAPPGREGILVSCSRAFGTGEHPTTRLAAALVEEAVASGRSILDVGCGTAILAALGIRAGATRGLALDVDPVACGVAAETVRRNRLESLDIVCGTLACVGADARFGTVAANIERDVLIDAMPGLARCTASGGHLILSGILDEQVAAVKDAAERQGMIEMDRRREAGWAALVCRRNGA